MPDKPITPTRIIPAGAPLPARSPGPGDIPPWRTPPPPPPPVVPPRAPWPDPPAPGPIQIRVTVDLAPTEPEPEPTRWNFEWLWQWLRPWQSLVAAAAAVLPVLGGESLVSAWAAATHDARTTGSVGAAYVISGLGLGLAFLTDRYRPGLLARTLLITAAVGGTGALAWFDPITALTGVRP